MPRAQKGAARQQSKQRVYARNRGKRGSRRRNWSYVKQADVRAGQFQTMHRQQRKRDFRRLWNTRISAAARQRGISYSHLMGGLKEAGIELNRKMLSEIAIADPKAFDQLVERARAARTQAAA